VLQCVAAVCCSNVLQRVAAISMAIVELRDELMAVIV